jgi:hypothetical protein
MSRQFFWLKIDNEDFIHFNGQRYLVSSDPINLSPKNSKTTLRTDNLRSLINFISYNLDKIQMGKQFHHRRVNKPHSSEWGIIEGKLYLNNLKFELPNLKDEFIRNSQSKAVSYLFNYNWSDPCHLNRNLTDHDWMTYYFQESNVFADWFTGEILIPAIPSLYYPWGYGYVDIIDRENLSKMELYKANRNLNKDIVITFDKGVLVKTEEKEFEKDRQGIYGISSIIDPPESPFPPIEEKSNTTSFWRRLIDKILKNYKKNN